MCNQHLQRGLLVGLLSVATLTCQEDDDHLKWRDFFVNQTAIAAIDIPAEPVTIKVVYVSKRSMAARIDQSRNNKKILSAGICSLAGETATIRSFRVKETVIEFEFTPSRESEPLAYAGLRGFKRVDSGCRIIMDFGQEIKNLPISVLGIKALLSKAVTVTPPQLSDSDIHALKTRAKQNRVELRALARAQGEQFSRLLEPFSQSLAIPILITLALILFIMIYARRKRLKGARKARQDYLGGARRAEQQRLAETRMAEERRRQAAYEKEQQAYYDEMVALARQAIGLFEGLPEHLASAEEHLSRAGADSAEGAFAPFWDSIEQAARNLGSFDESVDQIRERTAQYAQLVTKYDDRPPEFPIQREPVEKLQVGRETAERMQALVRKAQCDFQFAMIYEQRKTNKLLVAGFTNLGQALDRMTWEIGESLDSLSSVVSETAATVDSSIRAVDSRIAEAAKEASQQRGALIESVGEARKDLKKEAAAAAAREDKAGKVREHALKLDEKTVEMLDNIQRGRKPLF